MSGKIVSIELDPSNLIWLQARARATGQQDVSHVLNEVIANVRSPQGSKKASAYESASVVGMASISAEDPELDRADANIRKLFDDSSKSFPKNR